MSCKHGNWRECEQCDEVDAGWERVAAVEAECVMLRAEIAKLRAIEPSPAPVQPQAELLAAYEDAIDDIEDWAAYASEYFQTKWGLAAVLKAHRDRLAAMKGTP